MKRKTTPVSTLAKLNACADAHVWVKAGKFRSLESAWLKCERGDWMLWYAERREVDRKKLVLIACECARLALPYAESPAVLKCIETAEAWTRGEATIEQVREARVYAAAYAAAYAEPSPEEVQAMEDEKELERIAVKYRATPSHEYNLKDAFREILAHARAAKEESL